MMKNKPTIWTETTNDTTGAKYTLNQLVRIFEKLKEEGWEGDYLDKPEVTNLHGGITVVAKKDEEGEGTFYKLYFELCPSRIMRAPISDEGCEFISAKLNEIRIVVKEIQELLLSMTL